MSTTTIRVITPSMSTTGPVTIDDTLTIDGLKEKLGLDSGLKPSSGGVELSGSALAHTYTRISFAGGSKSSNRATQLALLMTEGLTVCEVALSDPLEFGNKKAIKRRSNPEGLSTPCILSPVVAKNKVEVGSLVITGNPGMIGVVTKKRAMSVQEAQADDTDYPLVISVLNATEMDNTVKDWNIRLEVATSCAEQTIELARRVEAINAVSKELPEEVEACAIDLTGTKNVESEHVDDKAQD